MSSAVLWGQACTPPTITATPVSVAFTYQAGAATLPAAQTVAVKASAGTPAFVTSILPTTVLWLTASPDAGALPGNLSIRVNPTGLGVGSYSATVSLAVTGVAQPVTVPVTLTITNGPSTLTVAPSTLTMSAPPSPVPAQQVLLSTTGGPISFSAVSGSKWLTITPAVGVALPGEQLVMTVTADPTTLAPQAAPYVGKITVTASGAVTVKTVTLTVNFTVNSSTPTISSVWPSVLPVGAGAQTITVRGTNFYTATTAQIAGIATPLATTVLSPTTLLAVVPATLLAGPATLNLSVVNPAPGGASASSLAVQAANIPTIQAVCNAASYNTTMFSPGEFVTIFGVNIGPAIPAGLTVTNGFVATTVAGVSVTVDGQAAPILYAGPSQVTIQVPYEATSGTGKVVSITNGSNPAATAMVTIAGTAPGIFTADGSGAGQAAALNYSNGTYTLNGSANLAKIGDTVVLYVTGEGDYGQALSPPSHTGLVIPATLNPLPQVNPLPVVTIGGVAATVNYAGPLAGSLIGLLQINAVVPTGATTGAAVPVSVTFGANKSQAGVTLGIHP